MDPDANLKEQLAIASNFLQRYDAESGDHDAFMLLDEGARLAELVCALDSWLKRGGYLPEKWKQL
jgi:hypothetical protein